MCPVYYVESVLIRAGSAGSCWGQSIAITGGTGALGSLVGSWAIASSASHVSLMSRSGAHGGCDSAQASASTQISIMLGDVSLQEDIRTSLQMPEGGISGAQHILHASKPCAYLRGRQKSLSRAFKVRSFMQATIALAVSIAKQLMHILPSAGGTTADALLGKQTAQTLRCTLAPKFNGALHLSAAAYGRPVLSCAYFSSVAALLGNPGQTNYAASNAALDGIVHSQQLQASHQAAVKSQLRVTMSQGHQAPIEAFGHSIGAHTHTKERAVSIHKSPLLKTHDERTRDMPAGAWMLELAVRGLGRGGHDGRRPGIQARALWAAPGHTAPWPHCAG